MLPYQISQLHCHTEYSFKDAIIRIPSLCERARELGYRHVAVTDHGTIGAWPTLYETCSQLTEETPDRPLFPIFGCEVYVCKDLESKDAEEKLNHLILLVQTKAGLENLVRLVSAAWTEGFYRKPRVDHELLKKHSEGLVCLSACIAGEVPQAIQKGDFNEAKRLASFYAELFPNRFYLEIQHNGMSAQERVNAGLKSLASTLKLPLVATTDCHYLLKDEERLHDVSLAANFNKRIDDPHRFRYEAENLYYRSPAEMEEVFKNDPKEALENTGLIAESCAQVDFGYFFRTPKHYFPSVKLPEGETVASACSDLARRGLDAYLEQHPTLDPCGYHTRLNSELSVIEGKGFLSYFLAVREMVVWAKEHGILVGPGRGSAGGSLVAFTLGITKVDPLKHDLLFERFLNPERDSLPDIDVDYDFEGREAVIDHLRETYGDDRVLRISTVATCQMKEVVTRVGKAYGFTPTQIKSITSFEKQLESTTDAVGKTLLQRMYEETALAEKCKGDSKYNRVVEDALALENLATHASIHASGVLILDRPAVEVTPLASSKKGGGRLPCSAFENEDLERQGTVKFDILGLRTLSQIQTCLDSIAKNGKEVPDLDALDLKDDAVFELFRKGETEAIFQCESDDMTQTLVEIAPTSFEDLAAGIALYRPGALGSGSVDSFVNRRHRREPVTYPHPLLEECLKGTHGVFVYQEQVMMAARILAGFSLGEADILRKAMGKKKASVMEKQRSKFVAGALKRGLTEAEANAIFDTLASFAGYGFNKSHAVAYATLAYQTAWLKLYHPCEFMASAIDLHPDEERAEISNPSKQNKFRLTKYFIACRRAGVDIELPSVNRPGLKSQPTSDGKKIILPLTSIKGVGEKAAKAIVGAYNLAGSFSSIEELKIRATKRLLHAGVVASLVKGGALDCLIEGRLETLQKLNEERRRVETYPKDESEARLAFELESFGTHVREHPLLPYGPLLSRLGVCKINDLPKVPSEREDSYLVTAVVKDVFEKPDKKGNLMAFVVLADLFGLRRATVFSSTYIHHPQTRRLLHSSQPLLVGLSSNHWKGRMGYLLDTVQPLDAWFKTCAMPYPIDARGLLFDETRAMIENKASEALRNIFTRHKGSTPITLALSIFERPQKAQHTCVRLSPDFHREIVAWEKATLAI